MILQEVVSNTRLELENSRRRLPLKELEKIALEQPPPLDLTSALRGDSIKLIAEIKKASPSRGIIRHDFDPLEIAQTYASNGAAVISVLTEPKYFKGNIDYIKQIGDEMKGKRIPLLRKDFILDPYQIYQSRAYCADSLLLIVAILEPDELKELLSLSHQLGMEYLVEVHNEEELEVALESDAGIIGINNRDLNTFKVDLNGNVEQLTNTDYIAQLAVYSSDGEKILFIDNEFILLNEKLIGIDHRLTVMNTDGTYQQQLIPDNEHNPTMEYFDW